MRALCKGPHLTLCSTRAGCLLTTGYATSFHLQPVNIREQILQSWQQSYFPILRKTAKSLASLMNVTWTRHSPTLGPVLGFPRAPVHGKPGQSFDYHFIQFPPSTEVEILETDVVIVGSGCGAGVCAKNLAEAGNRVIVVEKAYHFSTEHLPMTEADAAVHMFMNGGLSASDDSSISVLAGQAFGGGGTVNWSASLQTQGFVREEWAENGLPFFTSAEFQNSLDRVCDRMGVSDKHIEHNTSNRHLLEGARKLGYSAKAVPQNTSGTKHYCGYCTLGCGAGEKQGPVVSFLPDAEKAGAKFIEGFEANKVLIETINGKKTAVGIEGKWRSRDSHRGVSGADGTTRDVVIKAKRVIVSCGTLQSPLLLLRSGLTNPQIGRNLHLHPGLPPLSSHCPKAFILLTRPVMLMYATFPERINPWEGGILTAVVDEFENLDSRGHGVKLEAMTMLPSWFLPFHHWTSGLDFKLLCTRLPYTCAYVSLVRDRDSGRVYPDPHDGKCRFEYTPSAFDRSSALPGTLACAKILYVQGATTITISHSGLRPFTRQPNPSPSEADDPGINDPSFQAWLSEIRTKGFHPSETRWGSAHQMGTCRMGANARTSVVDPKGQVWGVHGLYVADASVFPSASGVNPMVTNMAISDWISRGVARGMKTEREKEGM